MSAPVTEAATCTTHMIRVYHVRHDLGRTRHCHTPDMSAELIGILGEGVALGGLLLALQGRTDKELGAVRRELHRLGERVALLGERVARLEALAEISLGRYTSAGRLAALATDHLPSHPPSIEGTKLALVQSERLLVGEPVPGADPDDARELRNYRNAFDFVSARLGSRGPLTEGLVREIHKRLVEGVRGGSAAPGEYRRIKNDVVNSSTGEVVNTPPPA